MKRIILCADDYGQNIAISQAIIDLLNKKRLTATSCMTSMPLWQEHAQWLTPFKDQIDIGLHFNLTEGKPLSKEMAKEGFTPLPKLLLKSYLGQLDKNAIQAELHAQINNFVVGIGRLPDFIDGHQHIHQFPCIRDIFFKEYVGNSKNLGCYVRCTHDDRSFLRINKEAFIKRFIIQFCGASAFKKRMSELNIPHNSSFAGVYDFHHAHRYAALFPQFLQQSKNNGLIMCHPGLPNQDESDSIQDARHYEYEYLLSEQFSKDCKRLQIDLSRLRK